MNYWKGIKISHLSLWTNCNVTNRNVTNHIFWGVLKHVASKLPNFGFKLFVILLGVMLAGFNFEICHSYE